MYFVYLCRDFNSVAEILTFFYVLALCQNYFTSGVHPLVLCTCLNVKCFIVVISSSFNRVFEMAFDVPVR